MGRGIGVWNARGKRRSEVTFRVFAVQGRETELRKTHREGGQETHRFARALVRDPGA